MTILSMRVRTIAPSSQFSLSDYELGMAVIRSLGCTVLGETALRKNPCFRLNGTDEERLEELQSALNDPKCNVVWQVRGGYGLTRILSDLQLLPSVAQKKPIVIGFSDATALMGHLWTNYQLKSLHGPGVTMLHKEPPEVIEAFCRILQGNAQSVVYPKIAPLFLPTNISACIEGPIFPANLCMLNHLIGTPSMLDLKGSILILEDIAEMPYQIDRRLTHLWTSGSLAGVKAVIVGHLTNCGEPAMDALNVFQERFTHFGIPLFSGLPVGHTSPNWPVPFGAGARLTIGSDSATLQITQEIIES